MWWEEFKQRFPLGKFQIHQAVLVEGVTVSGHQTVEDFAQQVMQFIWQSMTTIDDGIDQMLNFFVTHFPFFGSGYFSAAGISVAGLAVVRAFLVLTLSTA